MTNRFIPAYAGNASAAVTPVSARTVHPRIRGERASRSIWCARTSGSSPHTRGTRRPCSQSAASERFIPAYAGNATQRTRSGSRATVHPRIRGERWRACRSRQAGPGSSPHTRGTRTERTGKTVTSTVHPRIRGERHFPQSHRRGDNGSSPHTRGTRTISVD